MDFTIWNGSSANVGAIVCPDFSLNNGKINNTGNVRR